MECQLTSWLNAVSVVKSWYVKGSISCPWRGNELSDLKGLFFSTYSGCDHAGRPWSRLAWCFQGISRTEALGGEDGTYERGWDAPHSLSFRDWDQANPPKVSASAILVIMAGGESGALWLNGKSQIPARNICSPPLLSPSVTTLSTTSCYQIQPQCCTSGWEMEPATHDTTRLTARRGNHAAFGVVCPASWCTHPQTSEGADAKVNAFPPLALGLPEEDRGSGAQSPEFNLRQGPLEN